MDGHAKEILHHLLSIPTFFETDDDRLTINLSGTHYEINARDLFNFPETILGDPFERAYYLVRQSKDYFIPRHPTSFESILYYYISDGMLIKPETIPSIIFYEEIRFFRLNEKLIETFYRDYLAVHEKKNSSKEEIFHRSGIYFSSLLNTCSAVFNALAIYSLCLETMSVYRNWHHTVWMVRHPPKPANRTEGFQCEDISLRPYQFIPSPNSENTILELVCVTWLVPIIEFIRIPLKI